MKKPLAVIFALLGLLCATSAVRAYSRHESVARIGANYGGPISPNVATATATLCFGVAIYGFVGGRKSSK